MTPITPTLYPCENAFSVSQTGKRKTLADNVLQSRYIDRLRIAIDLWQMSRFNKIARIFNMNG